jgi:hypothetical protein
MTNVNVQLESYFPVTTGYGYNIELAEYYLPIIKRILNENYDTQFFYKGR